ncbi:MAG: phosphoribosylanthranilate isomerase [Pseudomonadota bacterium]
MSSVKIKICGLTEAAHVSQAVAAGADYLGFNFFPKSPRFVSHEKAAALMADVPERVQNVVLVVNYSDDEMDALVGVADPDILQLHGSETPERVAEVKARYGLPVMKAFGIATSDDLVQIDRYGAVADYLLIDAKPPKGADRPGGNAVTFDWSLLAGRDMGVPWLLAGGLVPENVAEAITKTGADHVDVSSGVESAPGVKDAALMQSFITAARNA